MSYVVYAHRAAGHAEVRYIGLTSVSPQSRLAFETAMARKRKLSCRPLRERDEWLLNTKVDSVVLAEAETLAQARWMERAMVVAFARLGHRLFNRWLMPRELRLAA